MKAAKPNSRMAPPLAGLLIRAARVIDFEAIAAISAMPSFRAGTLRLPFQSADLTRKFLESQGENDLSIVEEF